VGTKERHGLFVARPGAYILIVLAVIAGALPFSFRDHSIFACQAPEYGSDRYLSFCNTTGYGDYDYGAFWFGLEPAAIAAATQADVLFLGNSRMQLGFSTQATNEWFSAMPTSYFLLGFSHNGNYRFEAPLLDKLHPQAALYVIDLDLFFEQAETAPAGVVMHDDAAKPRYQRKRQWQRVHQSLCGSRPAICGNGAAFSRSRATGAWRVGGRGFTGERVTYKDSVEQSVLNAYTSAGNDFLSDLPVRRECAILTVVPYVNTEIGTMKAVAAALGTQLVAPQLDGLNTFDGIHLDQPSAQRWSAAFLEAAGPQVRSCLNEPSDAPTVAESPSRLR